MGMRYSFIFMRLCHQKHPKKIVRNNESRFAYTSVVFELNVCDVRIGKLIAASMLKWGNLCVLKIRQVEGGGVGGREEGRG